MYVVWDFFCDIQTPSEFNMYLHGEWFLWGKRSCGYWKIGLLDITSQNHNWKDVSYQSKDWYCRQEDSFDDKTRQIFLLFIHFEKLQN